MLKKLKLSHKLLIALLAVGILPMAVTGLVSLINASRSLHEQSFAKLDAIRGIKGHQVESYFELRQHDLEDLGELMEVLRDEEIDKFEAVSAGKQAELEVFLNGYLYDIQFLAESPSVHALYDALTQYHLDTGVAEDGSYDVGSPDYRRIYDQYGKSTTQLVENRGFEEMIVMCAAHGHVMFSTARREDLGTNLRYGRYKDSVLRKLWERVVETRKPVFVDFESYAANGERPTAFAGTPMFSNGQLIGVMAVQVSLTDINAIMTRNRGLGESAESYLVGPDRLMRSDSLLDPVHRSVAASFADPTKGRVDTEAVREAVAGQTGTGVIAGYRGTPLLSHWGPFRYGDMTWAFITEIELDVVFNPVNAKGQEYLKRFIELNGYYDLLFIDTSGFVFHSITKEADYRTNLLHGPYRDTNLGRLLARVLKEKRVGFVDFAPYAPSNNAPAAFMAQPVMSDNEVEMVVALQVSIDDIDRLMQQRDGMGETGETYLVGPDQRMRSDSYRDPQDHSIAASFAGTVQRNGVDTEASREALAGRSGSGVIVDYSGSRVLSSWMPVAVGQVTWAVIAEIDAAEAFARERELQWSIALLALLVIAVVVAIALWLARSITRPIGQAVAFSSRIAEGHLGDAITTRSHDEVGNLVRAMGGMSTKLRGIVADVRSATDNVVTAAGEITKGNMELSQRTEEQASSLEETASSMEELTSTVKQNADNAEQANTLAGDARKRAEKGGVVAREATEAMSKINKSSKRIADIIGVIDEIAFQTNLLSLNAAVEAARAGEHGRGFAVVADEVRKLAQRSADAAKEIKELIGDSVDKVADGSRLVDASGQTLDQIVGAVKQVSEIVAEITAASREQSVGIEQVNKAVIQMDEVTQQNASLVEEAAAAAGALEEQARQLQAAMGFFKVDAEEETAGDNSGPGMKTFHLPAPNQSAAHSAAQSLPRPDMPAGRSEQHFARQSERAVGSDAQAAKRSTVVKHGDDEWEEF